MTWYDPGISCGIFFSGSKIGDLGLLNPEVKQGYDLDLKEVYLFELDMGAVLSLLPGERRFEPFARFPAVYRDISIIIEKAIESIKVQEIIEKEGEGLVESVTLFDLYEGGRLKSSEKALTFRLCYRSEDGTLDGRVVNQRHETIIHKLEEELGGRLREG